MKTSIAILVGVLAFGLVHPVSADEPWVIHEWGTFTSLQDEQGNSLGGVNVDDEPLPEFVHNLSPYLLRDAFLSNAHWVNRSKAAPRRHPRVTMRLETPVIYFYPPMSENETRSLDVSVEFNGGWLTEFYPLATASAPNLNSGSFEFGELTPNTVGGLHWPSVVVGLSEEDLNIPRTDEHVWVAPRQTTAAPVVVGEESEHYLFYRGVGDIDAPLRTETNRDEDLLLVRSNVGSALADEDSTMMFDRAWLVDIRSDGTSAFRTIDAFQAGHDSESVIAKTSYRFSEDDYSAENLASVREQMHDALVADGLFTDEATAMLNTWQRAYFISPGLRLFYVVPREWTDATLPLSVEGVPDVETTRVMIGRIELISDTQRELLERLASGTISDGNWVRNIPESEVSEKFFAGREFEIDALGTDVPDDYRIYMELGRFRNALVIAEQRRTESVKLQQFIQNNRLEPFAIQ